MPKGIRICHIGLFFKINVKVIISYYNINLKNNLNVIVNDYDVNDIYIYIYIYILTCHTI